MSSNTVLNKVFNEVKHILYKECTEEIHVAQKYFKEMFEYTVFNGKLNRANAVINAYRVLSNDNDSLKTKLAHVIGCCIEIMQASFLIHDDIMDDAQTRRNKRCWYLIGQDKGYGLIAVNDGLHLSTVIQKILKHYFKSTPYYVELIELFNETIYRTCSGQCLDMLTSSNKLDWENFTQSRYKSIVKWKTAYYSYNLPIASAMILAGECDEEIYKEAEKILLKIGEYFQIQDDYLDFYGNPEILGKIGKDIEEGKCCWLVIQALNLANDSQIAKLKENYGKKDSECVEIIRNLYKDLQLDNIYNKYESTIYVEIIEMIEKFASHYGSKLPKEIFIDLLNQIHKRNK